MNSVKAVTCGVLFGFVCNVILCPFIIPLLRKLKFGQPVRSDGPQTHLVKQGTPTMGGVMIVLATLIATLPYIFMGNKNAIAVILITLGYAIVGFIDDYLKVVKKNTDGLSPWQKIIFQVIVTVAFAVYILKFTDLGTGVMIPFIKGEVKLGILYIPFLFFVMVGTVNSVNLTDGLDGLASSITACVSGFFIGASLFLGKSVISGPGSLAPVCGTLLGSLLGFLIFNSHPAKVFMGDTGSLALGGFVASTAILLKMPVFLVIVGLVYVCESLSVIIQTTYFKYTKKKYGEGRRVFKMAPIHHHFEKSGMKEVKVVALFTIVTAVLCLIGILSINI
ncbi:MAG: phospho-N-acetylmuramoyl-pentapeptide-transferase [Firmicutes bacterium]|nr:phospho-N-acetylmuramoyl-pentapeptide-transferase [Bacillota bacterium]